MKSLKFVAVLLLSIATLSATAQKKTKNFVVSKTFDIPAEKLWANVGEDYGAIFKAHPSIVKSEYTGGALVGKEGAERMCYFNEKETKFLKEVMMDYDAENMKFKNQITQSGKFPLDPDASYAIYQVKDLGNGKSSLTFDMTFRTKPAFMGGMAKRKFIKGIGNYMIAIEHHIKTGETVNKENFKEIKKAYNAKPTVS